MTAAGRSGPEWRVLLLAPTEKDADLTAGILSRAGLACVACNDLQRICDGLAEGAGAIVLPEECVGPDSNVCLVQWLARQESWSDLPLLILARPGADSNAVAHAMDRLGNVTVLERPMRVAALVSAVRTALRARERQYQIREQMAERERGAEVLRQRVEEMQTLMDTLPVGVFIAHDPDCKVVTGNRAATELLRMSSDANLSKSAPLAQRPTHFRVCRNGVEIPVSELPVQRAARGESVRNDSVDQVFDDGTVTRTLVSAHPVYGRDGELRGAVAAILDVTEYRRAEEALKEAARRKDEFLAVLAHELRNPLAPIRNSLHILRLTKGHDPAVARVNEMLERQVNNMVRLVDDLLEVSRITRGSIELRRERIEIANVVRTAVETSQPLIDSLQHRLTVTLPERTLELDVDPVRLTQVFANLLNNAAKYTEAGGDIRLTVSAEGQWAVVSVRDSGIGIPRDMLSRVFDLFTQIDRRADRSQGGLGIGLTLVKTLVEMHGGTVQAESEGPGHGTEVLVRLPLARVERSDAIAASRKALPSELTVHRVLLVDDNCDAADTLAMLLRILGATVRVVYNGPDALASLPDFRPSVVLLDLGMPGMDGHEVARRIRLLPEMQSVSLIALTGWGQEDERRRSRLAGFDHHLIKPANIDALQSLLNSLEGVSAREQVERRG